MRWAAKPYGWEQRAHRWFAWFPVRTEDAQWVWLESVWRIDLSCVWGPLWAYHTDARKAQLMESLVAGSWGNYSRFDSA